MGDNTIALEVHGSDFVLDDLSSVVEHFHGLLSNLAAEVAEGAEVTWRLGRFGTGSIVAEVHCEADDPAVVDQVVTAYDRVGAALASDGPVPYAGAVLTHTDRLTGLIDGRATSVLFRTERRAHKVQRPTPGALAEHAPRLESYGSVEGVVETLARRHGTRFVVYPDDGQRSVSCFVSTEQEAAMLKLWGKHVRVEGLLRRDPLTGARLSIRAISHIEELGPSATNLSDLWGILPSGTDRKPEEMIRAAWDGV